MRIKFIVLLIALLAIAVMGVSAVSPIDPKAPLSVPVVNPAYTSSDGAGRFYPETFNSDFVIDTGNYWVYAYRQLDGQLYSGGLRAAIVRKSDGFRICRTGNPTGFSTISAFEVNGVPTVIESRTFRNETTYRVVTPSAAQLAHSGNRQINTGFLCGVSVSNVDPVADLGCTITPANTPSDGAGCFYPAQFASEKAFNTGNFIVYAYPGGSGGGLRSAIVRKADAFRVCRTGNPVGFNAIGAYEIGGVPFVIETRMVNGVPQFRTVSPDADQLNHSLANGFSRQRNQSFLCPGS